MIKKIKNFICNLFGIKACKCDEVDPHEALYLHPAEPDVPVYIEEDGKLKHCQRHLRFIKRCPDCIEVVR
jgi:hypothetical protein|tara:strand:+ start:221 stop:430 length:210 start_codon:yes stop_codon:yes gene_type:complete